jgi:hypothetical protein
LDQLEVVGLLPMENKLSAAFRGDAPVGVR